ncbi:MAG: hypothetical protein KAW41_03890 [Candidatus Diapherotrites archaeon]|nr:hypothetical protein [Candidatus Diapherotrites archaeon]
MNIGVLEFASFAAAFAFLFLAPGYALLRKKKYALPELAARAFAISAGVVLVESFLLASFVGLSALSLAVVVGATAMLFFRSASPG